jgi:hypothetical protein
MEAVFIEWFDTSYSRSGSDAVRVDATFLLLLLLPESF